MAQSGMVIIGTGLAGYGAAREFRKWDRTTPLTLITAGDGAYYSKPQLSAAWSAGRTASGLVLKDAAAMASELGAALVTGEAVLAADAAAKTVTLASGRVVPYSKLVLAMGAKARRPRVEVAPGAVIHSVNDLDQYRVLRAAVPAGGRLLILGAGLIGCEFAHDFGMAGHRVIVAGTGTGPLPGLLPPRISAGLRAALEKTGVEFRFGDGLVSVAPSASGLRAVFASGTALETDAVLSAIGFDPELGLANALGLRVGRGISVDGSLRTSDPDIFALGDCAEMSGHWLPFVSPLSQASRVLGRTLAGLPAALELPPMPVLVKTPSYPLAIIPPPAEATGEWSEETTADGAAAFFRNREGALLGFVAAGNRYAERNAWARELAAARPH